jgi:hypothetical protein
LCPATVHETVCVQALVTITPVVNVGEIQTRCVGGPVIGACPGTPSPTNSCTFTVSQNVCVEVPLDFSAGATAEPTGIICGTPTAGLCPAVESCTFTIGYYANHPDVTNALIEEAGGTIILGIDEDGASFAVTVDNANAVLTKHTPTPPAPPDPPLANQYQVLYAQLLAAKLNVLRGATCGSATEAIDNADAFLAASPSGIGQSGAPTFSAPLDEFNSGLALGCPEHCPGG